LVAINCIPPEQTKPLGNIIFSLEGERRPIAIYGADAMPIKPVLGIALNMQHNQLISRPEKIHGIITRIFDDL
jgi:hypothetical protein